MGLRICCGRFQRTSTRRPAWCDSRVIRWYKKFDTSSNRSRLTPEAAVDVTWARNLIRVRQLVRQAPTGTALDPRVVAELARLPIGPTIALLQLLARKREGRLELRVVDGRGREVGSYGSLPEVPRVVSDEFGERISVGPENVELVFRVLR